MTEAKKDGGPAFPEAIAVGPAGDVYPGVSGMSLRDWFAGQALIGIMAQDSDEYVVPPDTLARAAYRMADAMLAERSKAGLPQ